MYKPQGECTIINNHYFINMKKKFFKATFAVAVVAVAGYNSYKAYGEYAKSANYKSMLLAENVEALSAKELYERYDCEITTFDCKIEISEKIWETLLSKNPSLNGKFNGHKIDLTDLTEKCEWGKGHMQCQSNVTCNDVAVQLGILKPL